MVCNAKLHRWRDAVRLMDLAEIVVGELALS
jgi:hypothetical protein